MSLRARSQRTSLAGTLAALILSGCVGSGTPPPTAPSTVAAPAPADYAALAHAGAGTVYTLEPAASRIRIYAFRGGRAAFAGHNHVLTATVFTGQAYVPGKNLAGAQFDLDFPLDQLVIDDPKLRQEAGPAFASVLDAGDIAGTRAHMLGPDNLDAAHFPDVRIHCAGVTGELPQVVADVAVTLHGQTRTQLVPLQVQAQDGRLRVSGAFALRQTDFGVKPYSVFGGLLAVQDAVSIEFTLVGAPATGL